MREKITSKTRSWWQLEGLHSEPPPPQSQLHAKFSSKNSCENGGAVFSVCHNTSCWSRDQELCDFKGSSFSL